MDSRSERWFARSRCMRAAPSPGATHRTGRRTQRPRTGTPDNERRGSRAARGSGRLAVDDIADSAFRWSPVVTRDRSARRTAEVALRFVTGPAREGQQAKGKQECIVRAGGALHRSHPERVQDLALTVSAAIRRVQLRSSGSGRGLEGLGSGSNFVAGATVEDGGQPLDGPRVKILGHHSQATTGSFHGDGAAAAEGITDNVARAGGCIQERTDHRMGSTSPPPVDRDSGRGRLAVPLLTGGQWSERRPVDGGKRRRAR